MPETEKKKWKKSYTVIATLVGIMLLAVICSEKGEDKEQKTGGSRTSDVLDIEWKSVNNEIILCRLSIRVTGSTGYVADNAWSDSWEKFEGKKVKWTGTALNIPHNYGDLLSVKMTHPEDPKITGEVHVDLRTNEISKAEKLSKGDSVTFTGILRGIVYQKFDEKDGYISLNRGEIIQQ